MRGISLPSLLTLEKIKELGAGALTYERSDFSNLYRFIEQAVRSGELPSAVVGIGDRNGILDRKAFGARADGTPVGEDAIYPVFSVTKPIVGLAVMRLWERGVIHPGQAVAQHLPEFGENGKQGIKIWHLLTHTAGLDQSPIDRWFEGELPDEALGHSALYEAIASTAPKFPPGTAVAYDNAAFTVLAELIRRVTGQDCEAYLREQILSPLGMRDTGFEVSAEQAGRLISVLAPEAYKAREEAYLKAKLPSGGLFSTAGDLLRLGRALLNEGRYDGGSIVHPATLREMIRPQTAAIDSEPDKAVFGLTWRLHVHNRGIINRDLYGHNGMGGCMFWIYPKQGVSFVLLTNFIGSRLDKVHIHNVFASCLKE